MSCPVCYSTHTEVLLETPFLPVSIMDATSDPAASKQMKRAKSRYRYCKTCTHVFNATFLPKLVDYENEGCRMFNNGEAWQRHIRDLQDYISQRGYDRVVEIGAGDGSFLAGVKCEQKVAYEPSSDWLKCENQGGIEVIHDYFTPALDGEVCCEYGKRTLFLMRHVLEHIQFPRDFIEGIVMASEHGFEIIVEVPCIVPALTNLRIEDWVYEHVQHFTHESLKRLFTSIGCQIIRCETKYNNEIVVIHAARYPGKTPDLLTELCEDYATHYDENILTARGKLEALIRDGKKIAYWGGIGKSAMFLHQVAVEPERVVDSDGRKTGLCVPGLGVQLEHCTSLLDRPVDIIVITTAWRADDIAAEIVRRGIKCEQVLAYRKGTLTEIPLGQ